MFRRLVRKSGERLRKRTYEMKTKVRRNVNRRVLKEKARHTARRTRERAYYTAKRTREIQQGWKEDYKSRFYRKLGIKRSRRRRKS